jgi:pyruvate/2-oxoglutarate dehydrogenase complex dihydrolipoamide dehydrogenase (E3) component
MSEAFDAIVIGSGQGGNPLSTALANAGWKTAIIEREHVGGTCINEGCTPTKTMVNSGRVAYLARRGRDYGVQAGDVSIDMAAVRQRKRDIVESFRSSGERRLRNTPGDNLIMGEARFTAPHTIEVETGDGTRELTAEHIFINAGARPARPPLKGLDRVPSLDSTTVMELDRVPEHLLVLGGGYIGIEFGQLFRRLGSEVTIVELGPALMGHEDPDVAEEVAKILGEDGVRVLLETRVESVERSPDGRIALTVSKDDSKRQLLGSDLLLAAGRVPNTDKLNLAAAGVEQDQRGFIKVNERLETNVPGIYALGDVKGGPQFTHISYDDFRILRANLLEKGDATVRGRMVPYTMFMDPQLGRIGLTETEARKQGYRVRIAKIPMNYIARALEMAEARGFMKAVVDADTERILGFAVIGVEGGEIMAMVEIAMLGELRYPVLREAVFAHPTLAESLNTLFANFD